MKKALFSFAIAVVATALVACGNKQKNNGQSVDSVSAEKAVTTVAEVDGEHNDEDADGDEPSGITFIRNIWADGIEHGGGRIQIGLRDIKDDINRFAVAFCRTYPSIETNKELRDYFIDPSLFKKDLYKVESSPRSGYVRCMMATEQFSQTEACYWNRKNGHKLVAIYMADNHEDETESEQLVVFFDYDPATDMMTAEPALTKMIEERVKDYSTYTVQLPKEGKDIEVIGHIIDVENDYADNKMMKLLWNGTTFKWGD
ncbi:MAG: hypothetical protein IJV17_07175 [Prevotella sp.]|nr:hypothetical protein [Prevotella sp.]